MADKPNTQIIIRHVAGAKVNKIDPFALADTSEITFGREAGSTITFDSPKDDVVSRHHAVLRVKNNGSLSFAIEDLKSSNGTFVNGERITGEAELLPEDTVEFGKGGPKFTFDVQPRPANMAARTRVMNAIGATATRAVATTALTEAAPTQPVTPPAKAGIGKNTVMMMLSDERKKTSQVWMGALAAVLAFVIVGGGALYWRMQQETEAQAAKVAAQATTATTQQINVVNEKLGLSAGDIAKKYANSTVYIQFHWRLIDVGTGRPVFHKTVRFKKDQELLPAYVRMPNGKIVRWLTMSDESRSNIEVGGEGSGSGFVINDQGFILTNKHVASGWLVDVPPPNRRGIVISYPQKGVKVQPPKIVDLADESDASDIWSWIPERDAGYIFDPELPPNMIGASERLFQGKNEYLEVRFPGSKLSINAQLLRSSADADASLIEIRSPQKLDAIEIANDDAVTTGEKIYVLGYPGVSTRTVATFITNEGGTQRRQTEIIPEPTITDGIVSRLGVETSTQGNMTIRSTRGDAFQLSVVATGAGNSGGPVFNAAGKVIGLFTYASVDRQGTRVTHAVPIKHGRALLTPQRAP